MEILSASLTNEKALRPAESHGKKNNISSFFVKESNKLFIFSGHKLISEIICLVLKYDFIACLVSSSKNTLHSKEK